MQVEWTKSIHVDALLNSAKLTWTCAADERIHIKPSPTSVPVVMHRKNRVSCRGFGSLCAAVSTHVRGFECLLPVECAGTISAWNSDNFEGYTPDELFNPTFASRSRLDG